MNVALTMRKTDATWTLVGSAFVYFNVDDAHSASAELP